MVDHGPEIETEWADWPTDERMPAPKIHAPRLEAYQRVGADVFVLRERHGPDGARLESEETMAIRR